MVEFSRGHRYNLSSIKEVGKPKSLFNWVVFTEDGFGFPAWEKKDWRGDTRHTWDESVKTFEKASEADDFILNNKPCLSVDDLIKWYEQNLFSSPTKAALINALIELAKSKLSDTK